LKKHFHISPPSAPANTYKSHREYFFSKLQPLANHIQEAWWKYYTIASKFSIDKMMVKFLGCSLHTLIILSKPIPGGSKILVVGEHGYIYVFLFMSREIYFTGFNKPYIGPQLSNGTCINLLATSRAVFYLCSLLPWNTHHFILFCNNYFSNIPLFQALILAVKIVAYETYRSNSARYPKALRIQKSNQVMPFGAMAEAAVDDV
jgi:hypothetical protein